MSGRRPWRLPGLVMWPRCCWSPELYSLAVLPSQDARSRGWLKRAKSPISAITPSASAWRCRGRRAGARPAGAARVACDFEQPGVERGELAIDAVEVDQQLLERELGERLVELLARDPRAMPERPRFVALVVDPAVAKQRLGDAVARRGARAAQVIAAAQHVAQPFGVGR